MRLLFYAVVATALAFGAAGPASSQTSSDALTADVAVREALAANRDLQAARFAIDVARGRLLQTGRLANPELVMSYADDFAFMAEGERRGSIGFAQRFPITARLRHQKEVARADLAIAESEVRNAARTLVADVLRAFYSVRTLEERKAVQSDLVATVKRIEDVTARRLQAAEVSPVDLSLLRVQRLTLEQAAIELESEREVALAELTRLLGRRSAKGLRLAGSLDPGPGRVAELLAEPTPTDSSTRPDLAAARRGIERAGADRDLAHAEVLQDWTVGLGFDQERQVFDAPIHTKRDAFLSLDLTIPLPLWNRQQGRIAAAEADLRRARRSRDALALRIREEIQAGRARLRALRRNVDRYATVVLPEVTLSQALVERGYREGLVKIPSLLQSQRQYVEARSLDAEMRGALRQATIALEASLGTSPYLEDFRPHGETR